MTNQKLIITILALSVSLFLGCGSSGGDSNAGQAATEEAGGASSEPEDMEKVMNEAQKAFQGNGEKKEVIDFRELKKLLPETLAGMGRTAHSGEKAGVVGFNMSTATAEYREGDQQMEVAIIDFAGVGAVLTAMASWTAVEFDREDENGYERTTNIDGYKAFEKYNRTSKSGELNVLVGKRFIVALDGRNIEERAFRKAIDELNIDKLEGME